MGKGFLAGCLASCGAVAVTNPVDVIRTRLELQGELARNGGARLYRGAIHGARLPPGSAAQDWSRRHAGCT